MAYPVPQPIVTAPQDRGKTLLLWCPAQGGWQTGQWSESGWVSTADDEVVLEPTHWIPSPPAVVEQ
jgi:hypothetical protein